MNRNQALVRGLALCIGVAFGLAGFSAHVGNAAPPKTSLKEQADNLRTKAQALEARYHARDREVARRAQSDWASLVQNFEKWLKSQNVPVEARYRAAEASSEEKGGRGGGGGGSGGGTAGNTGGSGGASGGQGSRDCELTFERSNYFCWLVSYNVDSAGRKRCHYKCARLP